MIGRRVNACISPLAGLGILGDNELSVCRLVKAALKELHVPQTSVHAAMHGQSHLVRVRVIRVDPRASDLRRLLEHLHLKLLGEFTEVSGATEPRGPGSDDGDPQLAR